jgi:hypothetical protein
VCRLGSLVLANMSENSESESSPKPQIAPLDVDGAGAVAVGTALWAIAFVVLLLFRQQLEEADATWWLAVAATGFAFGLAGIAFTMRRRAVYRRAKESGGEDGDG